MLNKVRLGALGLALLCLLSPLAMSGGKDKPRDYRAGCHPILVIPAGDDAEPFFQVDCTVCIDCESTSGNTCGATAICSKEQGEGSSCTQTAGCPTLNCNCTDNDTHFGCECDCTGDGVECSWTDNLGHNHDVTKNCPGGE
jgi:hypothetical protein